MPRSYRSHADRKGDILAAAEAVILEKGLSAATTRDVTDRLGVGAGLLNHYFRWVDLRALAFERLAARDLDALFPAPPQKPAAQQMDDFIAAAFAAETDPVSRIWIEATELAFTDQVLRASLAAALERLRNGLSDLLLQGNREGVWSCRDPLAASYRLTALHDGLMGFVLMGGGLDREAAVRLFRESLHLETGWPDLAQTKRRKTAR